MTARLTVAYALLASAAVAHAQRPDPKELIALAEKRADNKPWLLVQVARTAERIEPEKSLALARDLLARLKASKAGHGEFRTIAEIAAPRDLPLRNDALREALKAAQPLLDDAARWQAPAQPANAAPAWIDPQEQLNQQKQLLAFNIAIWRTVADNSPREALLQTLKDAKAAGFYGAETRQPYLFTVLRELAALEPDLAIALGPKVQTQGFAEFCQLIAAERLRAGRRDRITQTLITYAVNNGSANAESLGIYADFDLDDAWNRAKKLNSMASLLAIADRLAWRDHAAALKTVEAWPDASARRDLIECVARVWAYKSPDTIDAALVNLDNEARRNAVKSQANNELNWRKAGRPPRDRIELVPRRGSERFFPRAMTDAERQRTRDNLAKRPPTGNATEDAALQLLLDNAKMPAAKDPNRLNILQAAAWRMYRTFGDTSEVTKLTTSLAPGETDAIWAYLATQTARAADPAAAPAMADNIKANDTFVYTMCDVIRAITDTSY